MNKFTIPKGQRENYFVIALALILVIIVIMIAAISIQQNEITKHSQSPTPTPVASEVNPTQAANTKPPVTYKKDASIKLVRKEEQRTPLSATDAQAKAHILQLLPQGQDYGTVYSSNNITIDYVQALDLFKVEILTVDVASAKTEAENWFKQQGMSQEGICDLPLGFYLNFDIANILKTSNFTFNPLPDGC